MPKRTEDTPYECIASILEEIEAQDQAWNDFC
jgi:hypothetical protein